MKRKHQVRNFFRHAKKVGFFSAFLLLLFDLLTFSDFYYTDDGISVSSETMWL